LSERLWKISAGLVSLLAGLCAAPAAAQDFTAGKTAAQLFASDCSACHKSPAGLAKGQSASSLTSFLREHYTTKPESAAALAAYLAGAGPGNARISPQAPITGAAKPEEKPAPKPRQAATSAEPDRQPEAETGTAAPARATARPQVDPVVAKLNGYAAARGEPKDTARLATPAPKIESYANAGSGAEAVAPVAEPDAKRKPSDKKKKDTNASAGGTVAPQAPRPRRAQAPVIQVPDRQ